jgi:integrase
MRSAREEHGVELRHLLRDLRHMSARAASDLADWLVFLDLEGKADRTLYTYHRELARLLRAYPNHQLASFTHHDINAVLQQISPRSRHISRSVYSKFFEWAMLDERLDTSPMVRVPRIKHPQRRTRDIFTLAEVAQLEALPTPNGQLFSILFGSGLRKAEARRLQRKHVDLDRRRLIVHRGKGGKDRVIALTPSALRAVADLDLTEGLEPDDHLWHSKPGGGTVVARRWAIADTTFSRWYENCITAAGVTYLSPHTTRHTYHELMRLAGLNLEERQLLMGHASIRTTADIYGHLDFDAVAGKLENFDLAKADNV